MKFNKKELLSSYEKVKVAIQKTSVIPIFSTVRFITKDNKYTLIASNSMYQITASGECIGDDDFDLCFPSDKLGVMLSSAKDDIEITGHDGKALSKSGKSKFNFSTNDGDDYPIIEIQPGSAVCDGVNLKDIIGNVYTCTAKNDVRQILNGVCISSDGVSIKATATDGHILASRKKDVASSKFSVILPNEVMTILSSRDSKSVVINDNRNIQVFFNDGSSLISKVIDGQYPSWETMGKYDTPLKFSVNRNEFLDCIKTASRVSPEGIVKLKISNSLMRVVASSSDGNYEAEIDCVGDDLDVTFKTSLITLAINVTEGENFSLNFDEPFKKFKREEGVATVIAMPMRA